MDALQKKWVNRSRKLFHFMEFLKKDGNSGDSQKLEKHFWDWSYYWKIENLYKILKNLIFHTTFDAQLAIDGWRNNLMFHVYFYSNSPVSLLSTTQHSKVHTGQQILKRFCLGNEYIFKFASLCYWKNGYRNVKVNKKINHLTKNIIKRVSNGIQCWNVAKPVCKGSFFITKVKLQYKFFVTF